MMANGTPAVQPQAAQGQPAPVASPKEANKTLVLAGISIGLIVIVVLGLFLSQQFVGKAIQPGALEVGLVGFTAPYTAAGQPTETTTETLQPGQAFYVDLYANLGEEKSLVGEVTVEYEPDVLQAAESGAVIANADKNIMLLNEPSIDAQQGLITFQFAVRPPEGFSGSIDDLVLTGEVKLATLHFVVDDQAPEGGSEVSVFELTLFDEQGEEIVQTPEAATFTVELPEEGGCEADADCSEGQFCENAVCQTATCADSDANEDDPLSVKGTVSVDYSISEDSTQEDACTEDGQLSERSCSDSREIATETAACAEGKHCEEGACVAIPEPDADSDGVPDERDNCPAIANAGQENSDADTKGDACDNCPNVPNEDQADDEGDGLGNECDVPPNEPSVIITSPTDGARVQVPFTLEFTINNWDVVQGGNNYQVFIDGSGTRLNVVEPYVVNGLADGVYTIAVKLGRPDGTFPDGEAVEDTITVTVGPPLEPEAEPEEVAEPEAEAEAAQAEEEPAAEPEAPVEPVATEELAEPEAEAKSKAPIITVSVEEVPVEDNTFTTKISATEGFSGKEITIYTVLYDADGKVLALKLEKVAAGLDAGESYESTIAVSDASGVKKKRVIIHDAPPDAGQTVQGSLTMEY